MRSQFVYRCSNIINFLLLSIYISLAFYLMFEFMSGQKILLIYLILFIEYVLSTYWFNLYYFFSDKLIIYYPTRIFNRKKSILYSQLCLVKYTNIGGKANVPTIILKYLSKKLSYFSLPSNSFSCYSYNKRKEILKFLASKGIPIEINSVFEKDENILD